jgi:hypothetical protein
VKAGKSAEELARGWQRDLVEFKSRRQKYLIYE